MLSLSSFDDRVKVVQMMCTWIRLLACAVIRIRVIGSTISLAYDFFEQKQPKVSQKGFILCPM